MNEIAVCRHKFCSCTVAEEETFCSDHCEKASDRDRPEIACNCGHPDCE